MKCSSSLSFPLLFVNVWHLKSLNQFYNISISTHLNNWTVWQFLSLSLLNATPPTFCCSVTELSSSLSCQDFKSGLNGVRAILIHMCRCSFVSMEKYFVLIMFILKKAAAQLYVEPNVVEGHRASVLRPGKVSETVWCQKVAVHFSLLREAMCSYFAMLSPPHSSSVLSATGVSPLSSVWNQSRLECTDWIGCIPYRAVKSRKAANMGLDSARSPPVTD